MKAQVVNRKSFMFILVALLIGFGVQGSYGQTITASTPGTVNRSKPAWQRRHTHTHRWHLRTVDFFEMLLRYPVLIVLLLNRGAWNA